MQLNWNWTLFCGHEDNLIVWDPSVNDFGQCFEIVCLQFPLLTLLSVVSAYYCGKQTDWIVRSSFELTVLQLRYFSTLLLVALPIVRTYYQVTFNVEPLPPAQYFVSAVECLAWLTHFVYVLALRHRLGPSLRGPCLILLLWLAHFAFQCLRFRTLYRTSGLTADGDVHVMFESACLILHCVYGATLLPSSQGTADRSSTYQHFSSVAESPRLLHSFSRFREDDGDYLGVAGEGCGMLSRLMFSWVNPLMNKGVAGKLTSADDLFDLPLSLTAAYTSMQLERALAQYKLLRALHKCFWKEFYGVGILKFIADVTGFFGPLLLNKLVTFIETKCERVEDGYMYAAGLCAITLTGAFCLSHFNYLMAKVGLKIRAAIICIIYKKTLTLSTITLSNFSTGEIVNFMSTDTDRIVNSCPSFHACWSIPFQIAVSLYLLYQQVGMAFLAGVVFSLVLIPINKCIASKIGKLSTKLMKYKDSRVKLTLAVLRGIKTVKLSALEGHFIKKITDERKKELYYLKWRKYLDALCVYFWATTPVVISILTFTTYTIMGNKLTAATVFTSIALLNMLISPLNAFPWVLNGLTEAWVSLKRIQRLLEADDLDMGEYYSPFLKSHSLDGALLVENGSFDWGVGKYYLHGINFLALKGQFIGVFGTVGCGKSSFLAALLAEMNKSSGFVCIPSIKHGFAYVAQTPWLQRGTIRDNILFGKAYDQTRYQTVVHACALTLDLEGFPAGDLTGVGEGGSTLSGGQRARVTLARAVYQDREVYLLDDILSAVDEPVARHILTHCINGLLSHRTRVLCTHQLQFLLRADTVIRMDEGTISLKQGTPAEVLPDYEELLMNLQLGGEGSEAVPQCLPTTTAPTDSLVVPEEEEEIRETGSVAWKVYSMYLGAVGFTTTICVLAAISLMQVSRNGTDWWMAYWVTHTNNTTLPSLPFDFENVIPSVDLTTRFYLTVYISIAIGNSVFTLLRAFLFAKGGLDAARVLHVVLLETILRAKMVFYDLLPLGQMLNRFSSDLYTVDDSLPFIANILLAQFFGVVGSLCMMVYGLPWLFLVLIPLVPIYLWLQNHYRLTSRELKRLSSVTLSPLYNHFSETLLGLMTIRAFRAVPRFRHNNDLRLETNQKAQLSSQAASQWLSLRLQLIGVGVVAGVSLLGALQHHLSIADPGLVGLAISYALSITGMLGGLVSAFTETEREMVSVERLDQYLRQVKCEKWMNPCTPVTWITQGVITFNNVTLKYREHLAPALRSVTFSTLPGEKVGVVGRTGAGKSSLLTALFRLTELHTGEILVDSQNLAQLNLTRLRRQISIIPQEPTLFPGSVRQNVDPKEVYTDNQIWTALQQCHLSAVVKDLNDAPEFSVGQTQLLCLTRALLRQNKILCVDEATANVDEETDRLIQQTLREHFCRSTVLTIAHRLRTIMDSDRVLVMGQGTVLEFDTPDNLLQNKESHFYQLVHQVYDS